MRGMTCWCVILVASSAHAVDAPPSPSPLRVQLDAAEALKVRLTTELIQGYDAIKAAHLTAAQQAVREEEVEQRYWTAITPTVDELLAMADQHPADPAAVAGLGFVAINGRGLPEKCRRALVVLNRDHVRATNISTVTRTLFVHMDKPEATQLLRAVIADNPVRTERGRACNDLAWLLWFEATRIERSDHDPERYPRAVNLHGVDPVALRLEAAALYDRCATEFADVPTTGYGAGRTVGDFARAALFDLRHLQVGQPAPEITGVDIDGKPLRLSDHRGQVVVLVFSGEWCAPCRANAPFFRDLLKPTAQQQAPCVVLEVNTDSTRDPVRKAIEAGEITWPCWFDGGTTGPITMAWGVEEFPLIYLIDGQGVIRARNIDGQSVGTSLAQILADHPPAAKP